MIYGHFRTAVAVFLSACLTDALDGLIARLRNQKTELGAFLDPIADKLLIVSAFVTLALRGILPAWLVMTVVSRDIILMIGGIVLFYTEHEFKSRPSLIGKITTVLQFIVVTLSLILRIYGIKTPFMMILYWMVTGFTVASGIQYIARGIKIIGRDMTDQKSK